MEAEKIVNNYRFYAVFEDNIEYRVRDRSREIGTISGAPNLQDTIRLAGYIWQVLRIYEEQKVIEVQRASGQSATFWSNMNNIAIHTRILRKIREILLAQESYPYLLERARRRLQAAREAAQGSRLSEQSILPLAPDRFLVFPWCGTRQFDTQLALLKHVGYHAPRSCSPYYYELKSKAPSAAALKQEMKAIGRDAPGAMELSERISVVSRRRKYDPFVAPELLREAFACDFFDVPGAIESVEIL